MKNSTFRKTEKVLYMYYVWSANPHISKKTKTFCEAIERAISQITDSDYADMIELKYRLKYTHERLAEHYDVSVTTISKHRERIVNEIGAILFSDDFIDEMRK